MKNKKLFTTENLAVMGILTAISYVLYMFVKFPLPAIFPSFLEMQFSDLPALLGGFAINPLAGVVIVVVKCVLKMPFTSSACVGELGDILIGVAFVLPASIVYHRKKSKKTAILGMLLGMLVGTAVAVLVNRFILIPFYAMALFGDGSYEKGIAQIVGIVSGLYSDVTVDSFYRYYLLLAVVPFNLVRCALCGAITYFVYKPLSKYLHWEHVEKHEKTGEFTSNSADETINFARDFAKTLTSGDVVLLDGELGAGKTHFTKGLALGLGVTETVTSPTFTLHNVYEGASLTLNHFDFYRIEDQNEVVVLGLNEVFGQSGGVSVIEWWQNVADLLPKKVITVTITKTGENSRSITVKR